MGHTGGRSALSLGMLGAAWLAVLAAGMAVLMAYDRTPGSPATPPGRWPAASPLARVADVPTLLLFTHPQCPCSRASVHELAELMTRIPAPLTVHVLLLKPARFDAAWVKTDIWASAQAIPGVTVTVDDAGVEARRFGAATSGQAMLYDGRGALRFAGGLTSGRGVEGESAGTQAILALLADGAPDERDSPVFGCSLLDPSPGMATAGTPP